MNNLESSQVSSAGRAAVKEVDFYRNPTELFRWINYRRWEGAQTRAQSCPEEAMTWIVSTDPNTNSVQWRHLPLHLCCMQSQIPISLVETLIRIYPEATEMQDHEGRTPLHLACLKAGITENLAMLLLSHNPGAVVTSDRNNCTPIDLLQQSIASSPINPNLNLPVQVLQRMESFLTRIKQSLRDEEMKRVDQLHANLANERMASQNIINRLEDDLAKAKDAIAALESDMENKDELEGDLEHKLLMMQEENNELHGANEHLRQQIDDMKKVISMEKTKNERHDEVVDRVKIEYQEKIDELEEMVKNAHTETATARSMVEALEMQLKNKFSNEHVQAKRVSELESSLSEATITRNMMETEFNNNLEAFQRENARLKESVEELTKYNISLQEKVKELSDSMSTILASQNILSAEQDRTIQATEVFVREVLEATSAERDKLSKLVEAQQKQIEETFAEQRRVIESGLRTGSQLHEVFTAERERSMAAIQKMKQHFKEAEVAESNRRQREAARRASSKIPLPQLNTTTIGSQNNSPSISATSPRVPAPLTSGPSPRGGMQVLNSAGAVRALGMGAGIAQGTSAPSPRMVSPRPNAATGGNLSRILEQRTVSSSGSSESEYSDPSFDGSGSEHSSASYEAPWSRTQTGAAVPISSRNQVNNLIRSNGPSRSASQMQPSPSPRKGAIKSGQYVRINDPSQNVNPTRRVAIAEQRQEAGAGRRNLGYSEF